MRIWLQLFLFVAFALTGFKAEAAATRARLILAAETAKAGDTVMAGVHLQMNPGWHIYWRNPGGPGIATKIDWTLPPGVTAGDIQWPAPDKYSAPTGDINYIYHEEVVLLVPLKVSATAAAGNLDIKAKVTWLECEKQCVPGRAEVTAQMTLGTEAKPGKEADLITTWQKKIPAAIDSATVRAGWEKASSGETRPLVIEWSAPPSAKEPDFFGYQSGVKADAKTEALPAEGGKVRVRKLVEKPEGEWPAEVTGLLVFKTGGSDYTAFEAKIPIAAVMPGASTPSASEKEGPKKPEQSFLWMLCLAFAGGFILNFMPCVLPVIALKIFSFVQQSKESPAQVRKFGFIYGLGVLVSFLVLALLVIGAGKTANWGMQFQNKNFLIAMTTLVTLVSLNLFGLFEVVLSSRAMGVAGDLASKQGSAGAFFNGVLATALATPCTAPFLALALGFAFSQSPAVIVLMLLTVGAGMAFPYVVLSSQPAWLKFLPKPGAWMEKFKIAMGFPMLATAVWLFSLSVPHMGHGGALRMGLYLVFVACAAWVMGEFVQRGSKRRGLSVAVGLLLLGGGAWVLQEGKHGLDWKPWQPEEIAKFRADGHPVLVDFTADWCNTCKLNKLTSLDIAAVKKKVKEVNAVALLGDHTRVDDRITEELQRHQRAGVPLVLVYPRDPKAAPIVLPEVLTPNIVLEALEKAK